MFSRRHFNAEANTWNWTYHPLGQVNVISKPNGVAITHAYDQLERLASRTYGGTANPAGADVYEYHANSLLKSATTNRYNHSVDRSNLNADYDMANRLKRERSDFGFYVAEMRWAWTADSLQESLTLPVNDILLGKTYTNRRELKDIKIDGAVVATYGYDLGGRRNSITRSNGRNSTYTFDAADRVESLNHAGVQAFNYGYTDAGDPLFAEDTTTANRGEQYSYDTLHRLRNKKRGVVVSGVVNTPLFSQDWTVMDKVGNWSTWNNNGVAETRTHGEHHQLKSRSTIPNPILSDGNLNISDDGEKWKYEYDGDDKLRIVRNRVTNAIVAEYSYDALGRRIMRDLHDGNDRLCFYYDGQRRVLDMEEDGDPTAYYTFGSYIDEPVTITRWLLGLPTYWYHQNGLNMSVVALSDSAGNITERYSYTAYGEVTSFDANYFAPQSKSRLDNPYLFTGRELDSETGLYHYRARTYHPKLGKFLQRDPIVFAGGDANLYRYAGGDPVGMRDPSGLEGEGGAIEKSGGDWSNCCGVASGLSTYINLRQEVVKKLENPFSDRFEAIYWLQNIKLHGEGGIFVHLYTGRAFTGYDCTLSLHDTENPRYGSVCKESQREVVLLFVMETLGDGKVQIIPGSYHAVGRTVKQLGDEIKLFPLVGGRILAAKTGKKLYELFWSKEGPKKRL